jgi:hypothetical protein
MINLPVFENQSTHINGTPAFCKLKENITHLVYYTAKNKFSFDVNPNKTYICAWGLGVNFYIFHDGMLYPASENDFEF